MYYIFTVLIFCLYFAQSLSKFGYSKTNNETEINKQSSEITTDGYREPKVTFNNWRQKTQPAVDLKTDIIKTTLPVLSPKSDNVN